MIESSVISWYVVQTQPNAERKAILNLDRQGYRTYLPQYLRRRRHARRVEHVKSPLFPRYLFVAIDAASQRWRSIQSTIGVSRLVCNGDTPACVPNEVISQLRAREDHMGFVQLDLQAQFTRGDKIRILDGAFHDLVGLFDGLVDRERVAVLLELLGRKVKVVLDVEGVAAA